MSKVQQKIHVPRIFTPAMETKLRKFKLINGMAEEDELADMKACVMQATNHITGQDENSDQAPCVSDVINKLMIELNDHENMTDAKRARLKKIIPSIIGTAPVYEINKWVYLYDEDGYKIPYGSGFKRESIIILRTDISFPPYKEAEGKRRDMLKDARKNEIFEYKSGYFGDLILRPMNQILAFVEELANVAKFGQPGVDHKV